MQLSVDATPDQLKEFAQKMASDDQFRTQLEQDPVTVLAQYNIKIPPGQLKGAVTLPSKNQLQQVLALQGQGGVAQPAVPSTWVWAVWAAFLAFL